jgi:hypothetical protein
MAPARTNGRMSSENVFSTRKAVLSGTLLIIVAQHLAKMNNHDFRAPILGVGRKMAINRGIPILPTITANHDDLPGRGFGRNRRFQFGQTVF